MFENKLGKLYELMAIGDDLDSFYFMCKKMTNPVATQNDKAIMDLLDEAKADAIETFGYYLKDPTVAPDTLFVKWFKKWFGELP